MIGNKVVNLITNASINSLQNNFKIVKNEINKEIPKETYPERCIQKKDKKLLIIWD